jgi:hypothetical protein
MAGANSNIQMTDLDFNTIKNNLKTYLQSQDVLKDYNFEGSALATLLDVLAYNTQYNAYYLNMVANEMFLDTAVQRNSVVSQAKVLNYVPQSVRAPTATINLTVHQVTDASLTLPAGTPFLSESIDGVNYNFVTSDSTTVGVSNNTAEFTDIELKQGILGTTYYAVNFDTNPKCLFQLPQSNIDTSTLKILVQESSSNGSVTTFTQSSNYLTLNGDSTVYFLQEGLNGLYEVYFGDGILGKKLKNGNIVIASYVTTQGQLSAGANNFVLMGSISGYANTTIFPVTSATQGSDKESISSIKFQAPKSYSAQGRAVTKEDYITAIQQNKQGYPVDAVSVWGGEQNDPPVYGQVFVAIKPSGGYVLTDTQKQRLIDDVINPISVVTVRPTIVDPDYTYLKLTTNVLYDTKKTTRTSQQIQSVIKSAISNFAASTLNSFNSTFSSADLNASVRVADPSIVANETNVQIQKKILPNFGSSTTYKLYFGTELKKGMFQSGISSYPALQFRSPLNAAVTIDGVYIEELPVSTGGIESILVTNPGFGYQTTPTVKIVGDGTGATAVAVLNTNGSIKQINVTAKGSGYTSAIISITPADNDTTGSLGAAVASLEGQYGTLRLYYNDTNNVKTVFNSNIGTIDYVNGVITLNDFNPIGVSDPLGQLSITANPATTIISSSYNRIITVDEFDPTAITVNATAKSS